MKTLITADDFGFSENINKAIIDAYLAKRVTELSLMIDCFGSEDAFALIGKYKIQDVGLHFSLVRISKNGKILRGEDYDRMLSDWSSGKLEEAFNEEVEIFKKNVGFIPTHIIGHKHISLNSKVVRYIADYCIKNNCYARRGERSVAMTHFTLKADPIPKGLNIGRVSDAILAFRYGSPEEMYKAYKKDIKEAKKSAKSIEIFFHPGYPSDFEKQHTSFIEERIDDINFLLSDYFTKLVEEEELEIVPSSKI